MIFLGLLLLPKLCIKKTGLYAKLTDAVGVSVHGADFGSLFLSALCFFITFKEEKQTQNKKNDFYLEVGIKEKIEHLAKKIIRNPVLNPLGAPWGEVDLSK